MLGDKLGDLTGKVTVRRVLPPGAGGPIIEESVEQTGVILGVQTQGYVTYEAAFRPDGKVDGSGRGVLMGAGGERATWTATRPTSMHTVFHTAGYCFLTRNAFAVRTAIPTLTHNAPKRCAKWIQTCPNVTAGNSRPVSKANSKRQSLIHASFPLSNQGRNPPAIVGKSGIARPASVWRINAPRINCT